MRSKFISVVILFSILISCNCTFALADENSKEVCGNSVLLQIEDSETGEIWKWDIPVEEVNISSDLRMVRICGEELVENAEVSIDVTPYIEQTLAPKQSGSCSLYDNITLTTGLTYSANSATNMVSIYNVFGSTSINGIYYASNRTVYWQNPMNTLGGSFSPTTNSWNYSVNSTPTFYNSDIPPYSMLTCRIRILDMSAYRTVSVTFNLNSVL